jgi:hypothetical protein
MPACVSAHCSVVRRSSQCAGDVALYFTGAEGERSEAASRSRPSRRRRPRGAQVTVDSGDGAGVAALPPGPTTPIWAVGARGGAGAVVGRLRWQLRVRLRGRGRSRRGGCGACQARWRRRSSPARRSSDAPRGTERTAACASGASADALARFRYARFDILAAGHSLVEFDADEAVVDKLVACMTSLRSVALTAPSSLHRNVDGRAATGERG